jgi:hypothetical protein
MLETKYQGRTLNFWQLLNDRAVEIPIIQRDYAQGREDKKEIRESFLSALYDSLNEEIPIRLDFVYGSNESGAFQPLDGQQRLTTLFLLYWYAFKKYQPNDIVAANTLEKFSYETRITSREFCKAIVTQPIEFDQESNNLSSIISDSSWFFLSWKKDPTIDAMLRTIDDIHIRFNSVGDLWNKLIADKGLVSFYHVVLEDIGLTDDLYIKMNARGKLLSPFENFKASFQKFVNSNQWELKSNFTETFAFKIDTVWTDLFWRHRKDNSIDEAFMRFISAVAMIRQSLERADERVFNISKLQENPDLVKFNWFTETGFRYLIECLDIYYNSYKIGNDVSLTFPLWQHAPTDDIFSALIIEDNPSSTLQRNSASYTQKVLFYAQTEYLRRVQVFNREAFLDWMRVVRNIISRGDITKYGERPAIIRSPQAFDGVINLISELSEGCNDIYHHLSGKDQFRSSFAREQVEEEKIKAKLIIHNVAYKAGIFAAEDTNLLQGRIDFVFYCIDYDKSTLNIDYGKLISITKVINHYFSKETDVTNDFRRAMLTISVNGNYKYYEYWWSFWNVVSAQKRCLIDKFREIEYLIYGNYKNNEEFKLYLKYLFLKLIDHNFISIIDDFIPPIGMPNWKIRLIKEPSLLNDKCKSHYIAIPEDEKCCYLLKSLRPRDLDGCVKIE